MKEWIRFKRNYGAASVVGGGGGLRDNFVFSTELIMSVGHRREFLKLTF